MHIYVSKFEFHPWCYDTETTNLEDFVIKGKFLCKY